MNTLFLQNEGFLPELISLINEGHTATITARGNSMLPFIRHGKDQLVFSQPKTFGVGDVVLAEVRQGIFVCHRIVQMTEDTITMRGDGNVNITEVCPRSSVRAILSAVIRNGKTYNTATSRAWSIYSWFWVRLLPLRRYILAVYRRI